MVRLFVGPVEGGDMEIRDILDFDRFPIDQPGTPAYRDLVARCQAELAAEGMFSLDGLMHPHVAQQVADETAEDMATASFHHAREHNIYFLKDIPDVPEDHPVRTLFRTSNYTLCGDQVEHTAVTAAYECPALRDFLADVMGKPKLHLMDDALARLNVMSYGEGDALNWHFDRSEFTVTLLLQAPDEGGAFEYRRGLRSAQDPNYEGVGRLVSGQDDQVKQIALSAGTLNVFLGVNTAHRVTPVVGDRRRVIAVLCYYENPGVKFTEEEQLGFYGRTG